MNKNKNGFISAGIIAIIALSLIILSGGGYEGYKYYQQKKELIKEEKENLIKEESVNKNGFIFEPFITSISQTLGITFKHPKDWGKLVEEIIPENIIGEPPSDRIFLSFENLSFSTMKIKFQAENLSTTSWSWGGFPPLFQYAGQSLGNVCENNVYLDFTDKGALMTDNQGTVINNTPIRTYDIKLAECKLHTLSNGMSIIIFKGSYAYTYKLPELCCPQFIFPEKREFISFKGVVFQTKSSYWPGATIYFENSDFKKFMELESIFDEIIKSLSYIK